MKRRWWLLGGAALLGYIGLPYALVQVGNYGLVREGKRARREVALTFDDGPDPATTPAVLNALREAGAKATFFVLAARAEAHPELVARMLAEGHQVGAHAAKHIHAWLRSPWGAYRDPIRAVQRVNAVVQRLDGPPVTLHRPPHGAYTLATVLGQRKAGVRGAHWSIEAGDWNPKLSAEQVRARLERLLVAGAVVVLHDAGVGARTTVPLLPQLLADLGARGYRSVTLRELDGATPQDAAFLKRRAFLTLDAVYDQLGGIRFAGRRADNLFRLAPLPFPLTGIRLADGRPIPRGTPALEFHVNNPILVDLGPRASVRQAKAQDFRVVAAEMQSDPAWQEAEVIFCLSAVSPLLTLVGFETHDLPPADAGRLRGWANMLRRAYGNDPNAKDPKLSILTREKFLALYG